MNFRSPLLRSLKSILPLLSVVLLSGCYKDSKMTNPYILAKLYREQNEKTTPKLGRIPLPYVDAMGNAEAFGVNPLGVSNTSFTKVQNHDQDFVVKADLYWKMNWMLKTVDDNKIPPDFDQALETTRSQLALTFNDGLYGLAADALDSLAEGIKHRQAEQVLENAGVSRYMVPWSAGMLAVESFIDEGRLGFGAKPPEQRFGVVQRSNPNDLSTTTMPDAGEHISTEQRQVLDVVREYTLKYKESPTDRKLQAFRTAAIKVDAFLVALRRHSAAPDHPGLEKARLRTDPYGADYDVMPGATPTIQMRKDRNLNNAPNANEFQLFKP